jgi:Domain of unknown function (DUF4394)
MTLPNKKVAASLACFGLLAAAPFVYASGDDKKDRDDRSSSLKVVGLTADDPTTAGIAQRLVSFRDDRPERVRSMGTVTGLTEDTSLVGIDYRPATGVLYGVGEKGGVYTIDKSAVATLVSRLSVGLEGTSFGVDFNPVVDRLRIVSDTGQNLRHNVLVATGGTLVDGTLMYPPVPPAAAATATGIGGAAYTNNDSSPDTATTLFDIDANLDQVAIQSPANAGSLAATGKLGVDVSGQVGFDIYSKVRDGSAASVHGRATITVGATTSLYGIDLLSGKASPMGKVSSKWSVMDIAIPLNQL